MSTERDTPHEGWERELHEALKCLPDRPAPDTLLPRVMRAVHSRARLPWYRRNWQQWPVGLRAFSAGTGFALLAALIWVAGALPTGSTTEPSGIGSGMIGGLAETLTGALTTALGAALPGGTNYLHLLLPCFALLLAGMYATCIGVGSVVYQFARSQRS